MTCWLRHHDAPAALRPVPGRDALHRPQQVREPRLVLRGGVKVAKNPPTPGQPRTAVLDAVGVLVCSTWEYRCTSKPCGSAPVNMSALITSTRSAQRRSTSSARAAAAATG
ncbi:MAG: hypothetical protein LC799_31120, partial [Actinobacteria bacterium]|nr:hypothetical protein [Actinomycetota bacterium]